jgi:hypothetical protein
MIINDLIRYITTSSEALYKFGDENNISLIKTEARFINQNISKLQDLISDLRLEIIKIQESLHKYL